MNTDSITQYCCMEFMKQGFIVTNINFIENDLYYNLLFENIVFSVVYVSAEKSFKLVYYDEEIPITFKENISAKDVLQFLKLVHVRYSFHQLMKHYFEKNPLVQFYLEDFAIDDDFPTIRFYYKEIFWTITHSVKVKKWDLYEYHCEGSVRHLRRVSLKTIANYLKRIGECISKF